eukprot:SAG22_NODE_2141_length_2948_cov_1.249912_1_plen_86_part_10
MQDGGNEHTRNGREEQVFGADARTCATSTTARPSRLRPVRPVRWSARSEYHVVLPAYSSRSCQKGREGGSLTWEQTSGTMMMMMMA